MVDDDSVEGVSYMCDFRRKENVYRLEKSSTVRLPYSWSSVWSRTDLSENAATSAIIDAIRGAGRAG